MTRGMKLKTSTNDWRFFEFFHTILRRNLHNHYNDRDDHDLLCNFFSRYLFFGVNLLKNCWKYMASFISITESIIEKNCLSSIFDTQMCFHLTFWKVAKSLKSGPLFDSRRRTLVKSFPSFIFVLSLSLYQHTNKLLTTWQFYCQFQTMIDWINEINSIIIELFLSKMAIYCSSFIWFSVILDSEEKIFPVQKKYIRFSIHFWVVQWTSIWTSTPNAHAFIGSSRFTYNNHIKM